MPEVNTQTQTKTDAQTPAKQMDAKAILARFKQLEEKSTRTGVQISNDDLERIIEPVMKAENDPVPVKMISALVDEILKAEGKIPADPGSNGISRSSPGIVPCPDMFDHHPGVDVQRTGGGT